MYRPTPALALAAAALISAGSGLAAGPAAATEDAPSIELTKTVYAGTDGGASCGSALGYAEAGQNDPVTYCFTAVNTGTTHLASIVVTDTRVANPPLPLSAESSPLAPGHSAHWYVEAVPPADEADGVLDATFLNVASISALPVDGAGQPVPGHDAVMATAEAVVYPPEIVPVASMTLASSVYAGVDGGAGCPAAEVTTVTEGAPITWCHLVTNTGTTHLDAFAIAEMAGSGATGTMTMISGGPLPLAPGASALFHLDGVAPSEGVQEVAATASATAAAVDAAGAALAGLPPATGADGAVIQVAAPAPAPAPRAEVPAATTTPAPTPARAQVTPPRQLAFTGWETWLLAAVGVGLGGLGWLLMASNPAAPDVPGHDRASTARARSGLRPARVAVPQRRPRTSPPRHAGHESGA